MGILAVIVAAVAAYAFGAVWYMVMARPWMAAAGLTPESVDNRNPVPFIISGVAVIIVAGMMRHVFATSAVDTVWEGLVSGLGIGLFLVTPWIATNYGFAQRPMQLTLIDATYATVGCAIMGTVLMLMA